MKQFRMRIILILFFVALSGYLLYPTYADYQNTKKMNKRLDAVRDSLVTNNPQITETEIKSLLEIEEDNIRLADESIKENRDKRVKLGLDLQGGMYLVMEVNTAKLLEKIAKEPDEKFLALLDEAAKESELSQQNVVSILTGKLAENGIRLSRYFGNIREDDEDIISRLEEQESDAVTRAIEIISNRVNQYGVSEPSIQKQGARRIIIELPGISREEEAKQLLQGRALLEFKLVKDPQFSFPIMQRIDEVLSKVVRNDSTLLADTTETGEQIDFETLTEDEQFQRHPFFSLAMIPRDARSADAYVKAENKARLENYLALPEVQNAIPDNVEFLFSDKPKVTTEDGIQYYMLYNLAKDAELSGEVITDARATIDQTTSSPIVTMAMNSEGALEWARITGQNIKKRIAVVLDDVVYTAPSIRNKITMGNTQIEGMADIQEAKLLEIVLKAGALPAPVDIIEERTVGPSLGQDSINQGFMSTLVGFMLVVFFMVIYYKAGGSVADLALFFTILFIMGILAGFQATLTLPGIAGIILTIGMAVDANVLIFERIREELGTGKTIKAAVESGFQHSYSAIIDSNVTTLFVAVILYQFGSGPIQGFALTLMIGIFASLFSALVVTKLVFEVMLAKGSSINIG